MNIQKRLQALGLVLPEVSRPGGNYVAVNVRGTIAYVAIQFPKNGSEMLYRGRLGEDLTTEQGYEAFRLCALNVLAHISVRFKEEQIAGLNHIDAYYQAAPGWEEGPKAVDGASDLFVAVWGQKGQHARAIFGVERLPRGFSAGITASWTLTGVPG